MSDTQASVLEQLSRRAEDPDRLVLFKNGTVLTLDPDVGDFALGDVLVKGSTIVAVGPDLSTDAGDAVVVDATGRIVLPGFQDTHRHCWQGQMRRLIPDCDNNTAYLAVMNEWLGTHYRPHDVYVGNLISALGALDAGITSLLDFFHNPRTPDHSDAAIQALTEAGIRAVHTSCGPIAGEHDGTWPGDLKRVRDTYFSSSDQLLTLRLGTIGAGFARPDIALGTAQARLEIGRAHV